MHTSRSTLLLALVAGSMLAQTPGASISGSAVDSSGARIAAATVHVTRVDTHELHSAITNANSDYLFPSIAPGQ